MNIDKTVRIGTAETYHGRRYSIFCKIRFKDGRLSITGVEGPTQGGNCLGGCGQIDSHLRGNLNSIKRLGVGWTRAKLSRFFEVWKDWHLNDMRSNCPHQASRGETWSTHPSAECPDCGWKLGHGWNTVQVPDDVLSFLAELPDTDRRPAWV